MKVPRILMIVAGSLSLGIGIVGIIVPGLPTTPFLLLSAALYLRSSKRLYNALLNSKYLGGYIRNYYEAKGITIKVKLSSILLVVFMVSASCFLFISSLVVRSIVAVCGLIGIIVIWFIVPTASPSKKNK